MNILHTTLHNQRGVSVIITFFIMIIILALVLTISTVLVNEIKVIENVGNSISSFYAADTGMEQTLYFDRKQLVNGANRGMCNTCTACSSFSSDGNTKCNSCTTAPLASNGCDVVNCTNCQLNYTAAFNGRTYAISAHVSPDANPLLSDFQVDSKGVFGDASRAIDSLTIK
jgi:hypothetical protein